MGSGIGGHKYKVNLDISWLRDESLEDSANMPALNVIAAEIVEDLRAAFEQFEAKLGDGVGSEGLAGGLVLD